MIERVGVLVEEPSIGEALCVAAGVDVVVEAADGEVPVDGAVLEHDG